MGKLVYGASITEIEIDDRTLAHLAIVIIAKLRRDEKFVLSWQHGQSGGGGRSVVWVHSAIPLHFEFHGSKEPTINPAWLKELMAIANSPGGLHIIPEPELESANSR
jgi:hypothetical protein